MSKHEGWEIVGSQQGYYAWVEPEGPEGNLYEITSSKGCYFLWTDKSPDSAINLGSVDSMDIRDAIDKANKSCSLL